MNSPAHIVLTSGEPAGIGPDLCLMLAQKDLPCQLTVLADLEILRQRKDLLGLEVEFIEEPVPALHRAGSLSVLNCPAAAPAAPGELDSANAPYVLAMIEKAVQGCLAHQFDALVTAPVHKGIINDAGIPFTGHTEFIAEITGGKPVMMLSTGLPSELRSHFKHSSYPMVGTFPLGGLQASLWIALVTTHLPLAQVPEAITQAKLARTLETLLSDLQDRFQLKDPVIAVLGLNPHAGESGHLGTEEIETISPVLDAFRAKGWQLLGPLPADTAFTPKYLSQADVFLAMYHDQGLSVLKYAGFGRAVNITLGLPIIRTSVDHGTALELAGSSQIDCGSLERAVKCAIELSLHAA